jgi:uncharacterized membrane-anchored protein
VKTGAAVVAVLICLATAISWASQQKAAHTQPRSPCAVVAEALTASYNIKPGMTRREVEKYFVRDGGAHFAEKTRYVYQSCDYLKVEVEFNLKPSGKDLNSPNDVVTATSKLFVENPAKD